jgi:hypothetical protein
MTEYHIDEAAQRRQQQEAELYRADGSKVYGEQEHRERMAAIRAEHAAAFDRIDADVARKVQEAEEELLVAENADPADALTTPELERANAKSAFVADDVERLPLDALEKRCRAALAGGDRPTMFLLAHHASRRVGEPDATSDGPGAEEVREAVAELRAKLDPDQERRLADARDALEEAQALREQAYFRRRGVRDAFDLYAQRSYWTPAS